MARVFSLAGILALVPAVASIAQDLPNRPSVFFPTTVEGANKIRKILDEEISIPEELRGKPVRFIDLMKFLTAALKDKKLDLPMWIDEGAMRSDDGERFDIEGFTVRLAPLQQKQTVRQILDTTMNQLPHKNGAYFIRSDHIEITNRELARVHRLLDHTIGLQFQNANLKTALEEVGVQINLPIYVDSRCAAESKTITHQTPAYYSVRGLLNSIADMHEWKLIVNEHRVMLIPRAAYLKKLRDSAEEAKLQSEIATHRSVSRPQKQSSTPVAAP